MDLQISLKKNSDLAFGSVTISPREKTDKGNINTGFGASFSLPLVLAFS
jgi:hypothetical protein